MDHSIVLKSYGKINLGLDVLRRREDGYHEVRMIMQTVGLYDVLTMKKRKDDKIEMTCNLSSYTKEGFDIESHKRLAKLYDELTARGCYCMLTNHNTELINELYGNKGYKIDVVSVKRMINSDASNRVGEEVIICNY